MSKHLHEVRDTDTHFKIDAVNRTISNFNEVKNKLFVGDHESEIFTFEMPRYIDGHDMMLCDVVDIHFLNQGSGNYAVPGIYEVEDMSIAPDSGEETITFSWTIKRSATQLAGSLNFAMHFACTEDGEEVYAWNTDIHTGITVKSTLNNSEAIIEPNVDILEQWRNELFGTGESAVNKIETVKSQALDAVNDAATQSIQSANNTVQETGSAQVEAVTLAGQQQISSMQEIANSIPTEYTELSNLVDDLDRGRAPGIVKTASGETVSVADASGQKLRGLRIYGKSRQVKTNGYQLFDASKLPTITKGGATVTNNDDGSFTVSGNGDITDQLIVNYTYSHEETVSLLKAGIIHAKFGNITSPKCYFQIVLDTGVSLDLNNLGSADDEGEITQDMLDNPTSQMKISFYSSVGAIKTGTVKPMVYQDGDGTWEAFSNGVASPSPEYEQPIENSGDSGSVEIDLYSGNLASFKHDYYSYHGLKANKNDDGSYTVSGTPESQYAIIINESLELPFGTYFISGGSTDAGCVYCQVGLTKAGETKYYINKSFVVDDSVESMNIIVQSGLYLDEIKSYKIYPMLNVGSEKKEYYPYTKQPLIISTADGLPGIPVESGGNYVDESGQHYWSNVVDCDRGKIENHTIKKKISDLTYVSTSIDSSGNKYRHNFSIGQIDNEEKGYQLRNIPGMSIYFKNYAFSGSVNALNPEQFTIGTLGSSDWSGRIRVIFCTDTTISTKEDFLSRFGDSYIQYQQISSVEETDLSSEEIEAYKQLASNYPNTNVFSDSDPQVGIEMDYTADTKMYIDNKFNELAQQILNKA